MSCPCGSTDALSGYCMCFRRPQHLHAIWRHVLHLHARCAYDYTHFQLGNKHESADAKGYTYQTQTVKPVFMADSAASLMELIAAGHFVAEPHVSGEDRLLIGPSPQSLCGIQYDQSHGSLTASDEATVFKMKTRAALTNTGSCAHTSQHSTHNMLLSCIQVRSTL